MTRTIAACGIALLFWMPAGRAGGTASARQRQVRTPDMHFAPTRQDVADAMLRLARVGAADVVYDLGSGDGRIPILAAQKYGARAVGVELHPRLVEISRQVAREGDVSDRVTFIEGDLFGADISGATVVTLYLSERINSRLEPKLRRELGPGTRIVSHQFPIGSWPPLETVPAPDGTRLFLWSVPAASDHSPPADLAALLARARIDGPVAASCRGEFRPGRPGAFAVAILAAAGSGGRYLAIEPDATVSELASFARLPDLSCYSRAEAEELHVTISRARTIHGSVAPRRDASVICGFVDDTTAVCWQFSPAEGRFVKIGGWIT